MFLLTMHPHISGHRSRIVALEGLIRHMKAKGDVWFATQEQVARYVKEQAGMGG
jgi:peptidoglycan-N-acetylglucosamine deacetylase